MLLKITFRGHPRRDVTHSLPRPLPDHVSGSARHLGQSAVAIPRKWNRALEPGGAARCHGNGRQDGEGERDGERDPEGSGSGMESGTLRGARLGQRHGERDREGSETGAAWGVGVGRERDREGRKTRGGTGPWGERDRGGMRSESLRHRLSLVARRHPRSGSGADGRPGCGPSWSGSGGWMRRCGRWELRGGRARGGGGWTEVFVWLCLCLSKAFLMNIYWLV